MDSLASAGVLRQIPPSKWLSDPAYRGRPVNFPVLEEPVHYECKVAHFESGGFEVTVRAVDAQARIDREMEHRPRGRRKPFEERRQEDKDRAVKRARRNVRWACRQIGATHLMTLTTRQDRNSPEELAVWWKRFVRLVRVRLGKDLAYVAVPEPHPTNPGHWHLHVAVRGFIPINIARRCWWACCGGRGMGNIDLKYIKVRSGMGDGERARRVASYLSKYMSKALMGTHRPDKKNYWRSVFDMPDVTRHWLRARPDASDWSELLREFCDKFGLSWEVLFRDRSGMFVFPDDSGFWYCHYAGKPGIAEPPF